MTFAQTAQQARAAKISAVVVRVVIVVVLAIYGVVSLLPFALMVSGAFKTNTEVITNPWPIPVQPTLDAIAGAWNAIDFPQLFVNSLIITVSSCVLILVIFPLAGYAFAVLNFPGRRVVFAIFVGSLFVPGVTVLLPLIILNQQLGLLNTPWAVVLPIVNGAAPIAIVLLRAYFTSVPLELHEAAILDGCSEFGIYWRIYFPLARSALITITILNFVGAWNEYVLPSLTSDDPSKAPLPVGLKSLIEANVVQWNQVMAASLFMVIPIIVIFVFFQRFFINGLQGSVKG